jgi:hypothetical protein
MGWRGIIGQRNFAGVQTVLILLSCVAAGINQTLQDAGYEMRDTSPGMRAVNLGSRIAYPVSRRHHLLVAVLASARD